MSERREGLVREVAAFRGDLRQDGRRQRVLAALGLLVDANGEIDTGVVDTEELTHTRRDIRTLANAATEDPKNVIDIPVLSSLYDIARHLTNIAKRVKA